MSSFRLPPTPDRGTPVEGVRDNIKLVGQTPDEYIYEVTYDVNPEMILRSGVPRIELNILNPVTNISSNLFQAPQSTSIFERPPTNAAIQSSPLASSPPTGDASTGASPLSPGSTHPNSPFTSTGQGSVPNINNVNSTIISENTPPPPSIPAPRGTEPLAEQNREPIFYPPTEYSPASPFATQPATNIGLPTSGFNVVRNMQTRFQNNQRSLNVQNQNNIKTFSLDPTRGINNNLLATGPARQALTPENFQTISTSVRFESVGNLQNQDPNIEIPRFSQTIEGGTPVVESSPMRSIMELGQMPTNNLVGQSTSTSIDKNIFGTLAVSDNRTQARGLGATFLSPISMPNNVRNTQNLERVVPVIVRNVSKTVRTTERIRIPAGLISENSSVRIDTRSPSGRMLSSTTKSLNHGRQVAALGRKNTCKQPVVRISKNDFLGDNVVEISNLSPSVAFVDIFRKKISNTASNIKEATFKKIGTIAKGESGTSRFRDMSRSDITVYRVVPISDEGSKFPTFGESMISYTQRNRPIQKRQEDISIYGRRIPKGINVVISNIPESAVAIIPVRRDITLNEKDFLIFVTDGGDILPAVIEKSTSFVDFSVKEGHKYEYSCIVRYKDGCERLSTSTETVKAKATSSSNVSPKIKNLKSMNLQKSKNNYNVEFDISTNLEKSDIEEIKDHFSQRGLEGYFEDYISENRDKIADFITHAVVRTDIETGETLSFGTIKSPPIDGVVKFNDAKESRGKSISTPVVGRKYQYAVRTQVNIPDTLVSTARRTVKDTQNNQEYSFNSSKFLHPKVILEGTISSQETRKLRSAEDEFSYGDIGQDRVVMSNSPETLNNSINNPRANIVNNDDIKITWTFSGNKRYEIDHFVIKRIDPTSETIISTIHYDKSNTTFFAIDEDVPVGSGIEVLYEIISIYNDYSRMLPAKTRMLKL